MPDSLPFGIDISDLREALASTCPVDSHQDMARNGDADGILIATLEYYSAAAAVDTGSEAQDNSVRAFYDQAVKGAGFAVSAVVVPRIEAIVATQGGDPPAE